MRILKRHWAVVTLALMILAACNNKKDAAEAHRPEQLVVGTTGAWGVTQLLNKEVGPDNTKFNLDIDQDGTADISFHFDYNLLGYRTAQSYQLLKTLHADVELACVLRTDTVYLFPGDTIFDSVSNRYFNTSTTNCEGLGTAWFVPEPRMKPLPFAANQSVAANNQDWLLGSFTFIHSTYRLPIELNGVYNGLPFTSFRDYAAPCSDFPSNATTFIVFRFQKSRLGYVELFVAGPNSVRFVRCVVQK
jgi:hypothetical protein